MTPSAHGCLVVSAVIGLAACGLTTSHRDASPTREESSAGAPTLATPDSSTEDANGMTGPEPAQEADPEPPSPVSEREQAERRITEVLFDLAEARAFRERCLLQANPATTGSVTNPLFFADPFSSHEVVDLDVCLRQADELAVTTFLGCWGAMVADAKACWERCQQHSTGTVADCWGPGPAPGSPCTSRELLAPPPECSSAQ